MPITSLFISFALILAVALVWFLFYLYGNPVLEDVDGFARVNGNCGDTMEIGLKIENGKIAATHHWTNGCSFSQQCVAAAANLARDKTVQEAGTITMVSIMDVVGELPETHLHCAQLAEITLQKSVADYLSRLSAFPAVPHEPGQVAGQPGRQQSRRV